MTDRRRFLALAALGTGTLMVPDRPAAATDLTPAEQANLKLVTDFCGSWSTRDMTRILPFLADDCVYRMTETTPPATGHDGVVQRLKQWLDDSSLVEFKILDAEVLGPIVITHRIDRFVTKQPLTWEGVGVFFVKDGKVKEWSDYTMRVKR
jgi:limonene-1,2-epoxide hydrolase